MEDLKGILAALESFYSRAQFRLATSQQTQDETLGLLSNLVTSVVN
jgi:hypothetical protein